MKDRLTEEDDCLPKLHLRRTQLARASDSLQLLLSLTSVYAITYLPAYVLSIAKFHISVGDVQTRHTVALIVHWVCYLNAAVNPLLYAVVAPRFGRDLADVICLRRQQLQPDPVSHCPSAATMPFTLSGASILAAEESACLDLFFDLNPVAEVDEERCRLQLKPLSAAAAPQKREHLSLPNIGQSITKNERLHSSCNDLKS